MSAKEMGENGGGIWIQGGGELASGVAMRLARCGYAVVAAEINNPLAVRRMVSFSEAVYDGRIEVEGITGRLVSPGKVRFVRGEVTVLVDPKASCLSGLAPAAVIDARMTKLEPEPLPCKGIPLIALGPGFYAGRNADFVIETHREARLGEVITEGEASPNTGVPGKVGGQSSARVVRSPADGRLEPLVLIGDMVEAGQCLGRVGGQEVRSGLAGIVRGLIHPSAELSAGVKVGDVDPRGGAIDPALVSDKALGIAGGVMEALLRLRIQPWV
ncbi:MAG: EF2563 family selenium-dependent molybdenum hydroxylase system protein [Gemmatimonadales bacterium]|nr:EF2563 family selenium-dependent molybdenum hydroxylase system protein [Gemmatimonadales bacterium]